MPERPTITERPTMMICWYALMICIKDCSRNHPVLDVNRAPETDGACFQSKIRFKTFRFFSLDLNLTWIMH